MNESLAVNGFDILVGLVVTFFLMYVLICRFPEFARYLGVIV